MGMLVGGFADVGFDSGGFSPTILGREWLGTGDEVIKATGVDVEFGTSTADGITELHIWNTGSDIEIRIEGSASGSSQETVEWWDDQEVNQGTPGVPEPVFQLGEVTGVTVNIYTVDDGVPGANGGLSRQKLGTFTDDDKTTFFSPTASTKYGYELTCECRDPPLNPPPQSDGDTAILQFTFRKAGYADYTISFGNQSVASANEV